MQVWTPAAVVRDDGDFAVRLNPGHGTPFAVIDLSEDGHTKLNMQSVADCDRLIIAAVEAKRLLSEPDATAVIAQAIAAGTPVIVTDDGYPELGITALHSRTFDEPKPHHSQATGYIALDRHTLAGDDGTDACTCTDPDCSDPVHQEPAEASRS